MTKLIYTKEDKQQGALRGEEPPAKEEDQILHLKRLLVTLKQHYEKSLSHSQIQFQAEQNQRLLLQKELESKDLELNEIKAFHDEEITALREQQSLLKDLLVKAQENLHKQEKADRGLFFEKPMEIPWKGPSEDAFVEIELLKEALSVAENKYRVLAQESSENLRNSQNQIEHLRRLLEEQKEQEAQIDTVVSPTSSHHLRKELETIKQTLLQGAQETKTLEMRYVEILNEKIGLEHHCKQLQIQIEHQSSNLTAFQMQMHEIEKHKKTLETSLQFREIELATSQQHEQESQKRIQHLNEQISEKDYVQDKYEQLKDEWKQLGENLEEEMQMRAKAEEFLIEMESIATHQKAQLQELSQQLEILRDEKRMLESGRDQLKAQLEESEIQLRIAQQHLAKKVKESSLLTAKVGEQQTHLSDFLQTIENQKIQLAQLQTSLEFYQGQEKRLQEQLHEAFKGTESQVVKWEEKYFRMYDKWQDCENRIHELKKFEEKHLQMQSLLANLGNFMGNSLAPSPHFAHTDQDTLENLSRPLSIQTPQEEESRAPTEINEDKYDLFGLRPIKEKYKPPSS